MRNADKPATAPTKGNTKTKPTTKKTETKKKHKTLMAPSTSKPYTMNPSCSNERSRKQFLKRNEKLSRGQGMQFKYADHGGEHGRLKAARTWLEKQMELYNKAAK